MEEDVEGLRGPRRDPHKVAGGGCWVQRGLALPHSPPDLQAGRRRRGASTPRRVEAGGLGEEVTEADGGSQVPTAFVRVCCGMWRGREGKRVMKMFIRNKAGGD